MSEDVKTWLKIAAVIALFSAFAYALACIAAPPVRAAACVPDTGHSPTPVLSWDLSVQPVAGYRLYRVGSGGALTALVSLNCWSTDAGLTYCRGGDFGWPIQRSLTEEMQTVDLCVKAYNAAGVESPTCSNVVSVCMPDMQLWSHQ